MRWPPWSGPPLDHEPTCLLSLSLDAPMFHRPIKLQITHPYTPNPGPPELFDFDILVYLFIVSVFFSDTVLGM